MLPEEDLATNETPTVTKGYVYLFRAENGVYKIGSSKDPTARLQGFATLPFGLDLIHQMPSNDPRWVERMLHKRFALKRVRGEWFALDERDVTAIVATVRCDRPGWVRRLKTGTRRSARVHSGAILGADKKGGRQVAFRAPDDLVHRLDMVASRLGLDLSNFLRMIVVENLPAYEQRASRIDGQLQDRLHPQSPG